MDRRRFPLQAAHQTGAATRALRQGVLNVARRSLVCGLLVLVVALAPACTQLKRFTYEGWGRDGWQQPERVIATLALESGARVADLGSGGGYFTFRLARAVGAAGRVYAVDVDADLNAYVAERAKREGLVNVEVVLAEYADPKLPDASVDLLFTCNTYHHLSERTRYFANARRVLRPRGRVAIVEFKHEGWFQKRHSTPSESIRLELEAAGYRLVQEHDFLSRQHFLVFEVD